MSSIVKLNNHQFVEEGSQIIPSIFDTTVLNQLKKRIDHSIEACAEELQCAVSEYLAVVSRWVNPSPIVDCVTPKFFSQLSELAAEFAEEPVELIKTNVICKNQYAKGAVPFHQDVSYSPRNPYQFTIWLSLDDVDEQGGALEVVPKSHQEKIEPPIDFWSPDYQPTSFPSKKLPVKAGDAIVFDSRIWHGSGVNHLNSSRFALVTRWKGSGWQLKQEIPPAKPLFFGMWTCGEMTRKWLAQGEREDGGDFVHLLNRWIDKVEQEDLPFSCQKDLAICSLKQVKTLHLASELHNGGDATGLVYQGLYTHLLHPLSELLKGIE